MSDYTPDSWVVLKVKATIEGRTYYKVLGGWSGGYLSSDCWRLNSGISLVNCIDDEIHFHGYSGSNYICHNETYGLRMSTAGVYKDLCLQQEFNGQIILMPEDTDWSKLV